MIEDAIRWTSEQPQFRTDGKIGVLGISFTGGLSIVAAGRESVRDRVAFVMSFGGHGDLSRAMHYLTSGEVLGDLEAAKRSSAVLGADHVGVHPPHDYGLAVTLLNLADRVVPPDQVAALSKGIDGFLLASSLAVTDPPKSVPVFEEMKKYQETLPEPSRTYMQYVNDRAVDKLGPILLPVADALKDHPACRRCRRNAPHRLRRRSSCCTASTTASSHRWKPCCWPNTSKARPTSRDCSAA